MPAHCVEAAAQHVITDPHSPFKGSAAAVRAVAGLGELISKSSEIRAEFRKTKCLYPPKVRNLRPIGLSRPSSRPRDRVVHR